MLAGLFGRLWAVSEAIREFKLNEEQAVDFLVVNGQSFHYEFLAVRVLQGGVSSATAGRIRREAERLSSFIKACSSDEDRFSGLVSIQLSDNYGATQIMHAKPHPADDAFDRIKPRSLHEGRFEIGGKILLGRRSEFDESLNNLREELYNATPSIEVISYDRILDVIRGLRRE